MSGPCRLTYNAFDRNGIIRETRTMKCWSERDGRAVLQRKSSNSDGALQYVQCEFRPEPDRDFLFLKSYLATGDVTHGSVKLPSKNKARRWVRMRNSDPTTSARYTLINNLEKVDMQLAMPRQQSVTFASVAPVKTRALALPSIEVGDTVLVRHTVTHTNLPGFICGAKIGDKVVGFVEPDIIEVIKRAFQRGDKVLVQGIPAIVNHIEGNHAMVRPTIGDGVPFVCHRDDLKVVA